MQTTTLPSVDSSLSPRGALAVTRTNVDDLVVLTVRGDIDMLTVDQLTESVSAALVDQPRGLIIDLTDTSFLSSAGMNVLVSTHDTVARTGHLCVVADGPATSRPMRLIGLQHTLSIHPSLDAAVAAMVDHALPAGA